MEFLKDLPAVRSLPLVCALAASCFALFGTACSSQGEFRGQTTGTGVNLSENNYKIIKAGAMGESVGFRLLGIIPFASPTYAAAKQDLYRSVGVSLEGRSVALANQTEDRSQIYVILFSLPKVTLTADVVEFTETSSAHRIPAKQGR